jgi:hypothetical protein
VPWKTGRAPEQDCVRKRLTAYAGKGPIIDLNVGANVQDEIAVDGLDCEAVAIGGDQRVIDRDAGERVPCAYCNFCGAGGSLVGFLFLLQQVELLPG